MLSTAVVSRKADLGIMITASHNPYYYNGYKIKGSFGGSATMDMIAGIEKEVSQVNEDPEKCKALWRRFKRRLATPVIWIKAIRAYFNWKRVKMSFTFKECLNREWGTYDEKHSQGQEYYRL